MKKKFITVVCYGVLYISNSCLCEAINDSHSNACCLLNTDKKLNNIDIHVVTKIGNSIITNLDVNSMINMMYLSDSKTKEINLQTLKKNVIDSLVEQILRAQATMKYAAEKSKTLYTEEEVDSKILELAEINQMTIDQFTELLKNQKINIKVLRRQIATSIAWMRYIEDKYRQYVSITKDKCIEKLSQIKEQSNKPSYLLSRIVLPVYKAEEKTTVFNQALSIENMYKKGANFSQLAKQFSKSPEASKDGDLGWVFRSQLGTQEDSCLPTMTIGSTKIVNTNLGYSILMLRDKKESGDRSIIEIRLKQGILPINQENSQQELTSSAQKIENILSSYKNTSDFIEKGTKIGMQFSQEIQCPIDALPPELKSLVSDVKDDQVSKIVFSKDGPLVVCVLQREEKKVELPTLDQIQEHLTMEKLSEFSMRELMLLKQHAVIS